MDMPVSQVNIRLFTRLPTDTGIGLLFATGVVSQIIYASGERPIQFTLRHAGYALRCKLAPDLEPGFVLQDGQWVRATGHLNFSSQSAQFHLMALDPGMFDLFPFLPARTFIPIGRLRMDRIGRMAAARGWGGVAGHYLTTGSGSVRRHHREGRCVGTGFIDSRRCLFREAARGIDWLFTNRAARMQSIRDGAR